MGRRGATATGRRQAYLLEVVRRIIRELDSISPDESRENASHIAALYEEAERAFSEFRRVQWAEQIAGSGSAGRVRQIQHAKKKG